MYLTPPHERATWHSWIRRDRLRAGRGGRRTRGRRAVGALVGVRRPGPRDRREDLREDGGRRPVEGQRRRRPRGTGRGDVPRGGDRRGERRQGRTAAPPGAAVGRRR